MFEKVKKELEARKRESDELRRMLEIENEKRMQEAERIKERLEREKQELRDYLGKAQFLSVMNQIFFLKISVNFFVFIS